MAIQTYKNQLLMIVLFTSFFLTGVSTTMAAGGFSGAGTGTEGDPYVITDCVQLQEMGGGLAFHYALGNDIDCSATITWNQLTDMNVWDADTNYNVMPQGSIAMVSYNGENYYALQNSGPDFVVIEPGAHMSWADYWALTEDSAGYTFGFQPVGNMVDPFTGSLNGNGYTISGLYINRPQVGDRVGVGLFGMLTGASVADINIIDADISGGSGTGILAGAVGGSIEINNYNLIDLDNRSSLSNINTSGSVLGLGRVGGIAGIMFATTLTDSTSSAVVNVFADEDIDRKTTQFFGGLAGFGGLRSIIENSSASGDVDGGMYVGGLLGGLGNLNDIVIEEQDYPLLKDSYASGSVTAIGMGGGLIGFASYAYVENSYASGNVFQEGSELNGGFFGGLIGLARYTTIGESYAQGNTQGAFAGGLLGGAFAIEGNPLGASVSISNSFSTGDVLGNMYSGGLAGAFFGGDISNSYSTSRVFVESLENEDDDLVLSGGFSGSFVGVVMGNTVITNVYTTGSIEGESVIGGFIGSIGIAPLGGPDPDIFATNLTIENAYALGLVTVPQDAEYVGGFIGRIGQDDSVVVDIISSYWNTETSGIETSTGGEGKTTAQMKNITTYTGWDIQSSTDDQLQYPTLSWQLDLETPVWLIYQAPQVSQPRRSSGSSTPESRALAQQVFADHYATQGKTTETPSQAEDILGSGLCPANLIVTDNMKQGDRDGRYSSYNQGTVTQVALLQSHINRILAAQYDQAAGPVDGIYGPLTKQGVERLQTALNEILVPTPILVIDGIVGPFTKEAINNSCGIQE